MREGRCVIYVAVIYVRGSGGRELALVQPMGGGGKEFSVLYSRSAGGSVLSACTTVIQCTTINRTTKRVI